MRIPRAVEEAMEDEERGIQESDQCLLCEEEAVNSCSGCASLITCDEHAEEITECDECEPLEDSYEGDDNEDGEDEY